MDQDQIKKTLMEELGLSDLPQDKQEELVIKMTEVLLKRIFLETMEKLDDSGKGEYQKLVESGEATPEQMEEFLKSKIANYDELVQKVVDEFKEEMKSGINH
ncbi:MAG: DUF5663 domain-containing protein [Parcubacteria group bacterium]|jgi:hypothetical protein